MKCYRDGGCGAYEMRSCNECPASKPEYAVRKPETLTEASERASDALRRFAEEAAKQMVVDIKSINAALRRAVESAAKVGAKITCAPISLDEYRRDAMRTYPYELARNERRDYAAMKLGEEAAEFMAVVNKSHYQGEPYSRERIRDELGDVLWALMVNATEHNLTLDEIMLANMAKRRIRYPEGV